MQRKKVKKPYAKNKRAFDKVFTKYREAGLTSALRSGGLKPGSSKSTGGKNPSDRVTVTDFRIDVDRLVKQVVPARVLQRFEMVYCQPWTDDLIEVSQLAFKLLGGICHSFEQRLGALFVTQNLCRGGKREKAKADAV
jgi:hypothetical protein